MLSPAQTFDILKGHGLNLFTGVPDSLLKDFCAYVTDHSATQEHIITANEGNAVAIATGHYLGTGTPALVYMQNSGIGNAINPLVSIADPEVYGIPMLLMIGWRGEPGVKDEPQHVKQGRVMTQLLDSIEIPWYSISSQDSDAEDTIARAIDQMKNEERPVAVLISKGTFEKHKLVKVSASDSLAMTRETAIDTIIQTIEPNSLVVSTTGMASRELFELREKLGQGHHNDFLTVGGMGHTSSIAQGLAMAQQDRPVYCLDGDGSALMHMGAMGVIAQSELPNLTHIVINNAAHDSVGGQPTVGMDISLTRIAQACGYEDAVEASTPEQLIAAIESTRDSSKGPKLLEVRVSKGSRPDLGRPTTTPVENKIAMMDQLKI